MINKRILYIGNNLSKKSKYKTSIAILSELLEKEHFQLTVVSNKTNKLIRLLDMIYKTILLRNKVDFVLIDTFSTLNFYYAYIISLICKLFSLKYIPILRGGDLPKRLIKNPVLSKTIFKNAYKNVAPSNYLKVAFKKENFKTEFIPNTIPLEDYKYLERTNIQPKLLWVRSFKHLYNPTLAIKILLELKKKYPDAVLCMVGPFLDDSYQETVNLVQKYNLEDSVEFTGVLTKEDWHKKATEYDVFINTTNFDNTPISVIEAMALGLTIVSTNVGGMPYLIENKVDGLLVDKENVDAMTNAIIDVIEGKYLTLSKKAREKAETFDWDIIKYKWFKILK
ncbi:MULTISPECIES: glycosyltransferase family 4 protein [unclassified Polaribacter]|uniref:glycosyltransferase family 4 protein n=1 Tax=unclassified Polaribacter TaxID=196858 RepID=UPI001C4EF72F|nr:MULTISPECIES: glycosyltransferase family 4 protein [unclassified Polaribacter]QXP67500.1 glycosyltransferase family 4 protein [Polaribacter sp. AHE13PA]QXP69660.1 glycosyltransferase family 4 protein [Polaribacter sp. R2A056_3_33]